MKIDIDVHLDALLERLKQVRESNKDAFLFAIESKKTVADAVREAESYDEEAIAASKEVFDLAARSRGVPDQKQSPFIPGQLLYGKRCPLHSLTVCSFATSTTVSPWHPGLEDNAEMVYGNNAITKYSFINGTANKELYSDEFIKKKNEEQYFNPSGGARMVLFPAGKDPSTGESQAIAVARMPLWDEPDAPPYKVIYKTYLSSATTLEEMPTPAWMKQENDFTQEMWVYSFDRAGNVQMSLTAGESISDNIGGNRGMGLRRNINFWGWDIIGYPGVLEKDFGHLGDIGYPVDPSNFYHANGLLDVMLDIKAWSNPGSPNWNGGLVSPAYLFWIEAAREVGGSAWADPSWADTVTEVPGLTAVNGNIADFPIHDFSKIEAILRKTKMKAEMIDNASWASFDLKKDDGWAKSYFADNYYEFRVAPDPDEAYFGYHSDIYYSTKARPVRSIGRCGKYPRARDILNQEGNSVFSSANLNYDTSFFRRWYDTLSPDSRNVYCFGLYGGVKRGKLIDHGFSIGGQNNKLITRPYTTSDAVYMEFDRPSEDPVNSTLPIYHAMFYVTDCGYPSECRNACKRLGFSLT